MLKSHCLRSSLLALILVSETACVRLGGSVDRPERTLFSPRMLEVLEDPNSSQQDLMRVSAAVADYNSVQHGMNPVPDGAVHWLPRLRALLRRELAEHPLRRPPGASCPVAPVRGCELVFDGCTPRAVYTLWALTVILSGWQVDADEHPQHWFEVREALHRGDPQLTSIAVDALSDEINYLEFKARAWRDFQKQDARSSGGEDREHKPTPKAYAPGTPEFADEVSAELASEVLPPLLRQLEQPRCRVSTLWNLGQLPRAVRSRVLAPLLSLADSKEDPFIRVTALGALNRPEEEEAWIPILRALESNHSQLQLAALNALGDAMLQRHAAQLIPLLKSLTQATRSPEVWTGAQVHLRMLQRQPPGPNGVSDLDSVEEELPLQPPDWLHCPEMKEEGEQLVLRLHGEVVFLHSVWPSSEKKGFCTRKPENRGAVLLEPVGTACIVGHDYGEFGGGLVISDNDSLSVISGGNPGLVLRSQNTLVLAEGLPFFDGSLMWLERLDSGGWRRARTIALRDGIFYAGYNRSGDLLIVMPGFMSRGYCRRTIDGPAQGTFEGYVVRVTPDGQLVSVD